MRITSRRWRDRLRGGLIAVAVTAAAWTATGLHSADAQEEWRPPPEDPPVAYSIDARLQPVESGERQPSIHCNRQMVTWRNDSADSVSSLWFHLYPNAFLNTRSTMMRELLADGGELPEDMRWGGLVVKSISLASGEPLTLEYVSPDDGNPDDRTVARVALPEPVPPGGRVSVELRFITYLPSVFRRMGEHAGYVFAAQWYPKLGKYVGRTSGLPRVREGWYCHQYHRNSEFFADFADYDVTLRIPDEFVTGATGSLEDSERDTLSSLRIERWVARGVVDFAWTAHAQFLAETRTIQPLAAPSGDGVAREAERVARLLGVEPDALSLPAVRVRVLLQPEHERQMDRHFEAVRVALALYGLWFGPYPYEDLTIVDPAPGARASGGMEYPQLVTAGTRIGSRPETLRPEGVIVHEVGHQWFMNILASNEAEEAWLDEGLDTYFTARALHVAYGPRTGSTEILGFHVLTTPIFEMPGLGEGWPERVGLPDWATPPRMDVFRAWRDLPPVTGVRTPSYGDDPIEPLRRRFLRRERWDEMVRPAWEYHDRRSYGVNAYFRPALFLATLRRSLHAARGEEEGERAFVTALREYARRFRFRHPRSEDFFDTFSEVTGADIEPLVETLVRGTGSVDYAVERIRTVREPDLDGRVIEGGRLVRLREKGEEVPVRSEVVVRRRGEAVVPVRLQVTRDDIDGAPDEIEWETVEWSGAERYRRFVFDGDVTAARLHPHAEYLQDVDRRNDSLTTVTDHRPGVKWGVRFLLWLENAAQSYGRFL